MFDWRRPFYFLIWSFNAFLQSIERWFFTRTPWWFIQGLPAVFVAGACLTVVASFGERPGVHILDRYNAAIDAAIASDDFETAELFLHKLLQIDDSRADVRYRLAQLAERRGEMTRAKDMMEQLAPENSVGHPGAHFWVAKKMLASQTQFTEQQTDQLIHHLTAATNDQAIRSQAHLLLAQLYSAKRQFTLAIKHFQAIVDKEQKWHAAIGKAHLALGERHLATREFGRAREYFQNRMTQNPEDIDARLGLAEAWVLLGNLTKAESILEQGVTGQNAQRCREALAAIYVLQFDSQSNEKEPDEAARLTLLEKALRLAPNHLEALLRLTKYLQATGIAGQKARNAMQEALANGEAPAVLHLILGTMAAQQGMLDLAKMHMEQATRLEPQSPVVLNNLAWVLAQQKPPQLNEALVLVNQAVDRMPNNPEIRETRGQILARMERWSEAIVDLELALQSLKGNAQLHQTVAEAYQHLGNVEMAQRHKELAEKAGETTNLH